MVRPPVPGTIFLLFASLALPLAGQQPVQSSSSSLSLSRQLPPMDGSAINLKLVDVLYAPGDSSRPHTHPCPVAGYVVSGAVRVVVEGEIDSVFTAGQTFFEPANGIHRVSANASRTEPARLLAFFVCEGNTPLGRPVPDGG